MGEPNPMVEGHAKSTAQRSRAALSSAPEPQFDTSTSRGLASYMMHRAGQQADVQNHFARTTDKGEWSS